MAVPQQQPYTTYAANGVATTFTIPFKLVLASDLAVQLNGVPVNSGYTISGLGNDTGSITFSVAPTGSLLLLRDVPFERQTDYQELGDFLARTVNLDFDRIWMALQGVLPWINGAVRAPFPESVPPLPAAATRAGKLLSFDVFGNPVVSVPASDSSTALRFDLANNLDPAKGAALVARSGQVVGSIAELRLLLSGSASKHAFVLGYYQAGDGGGGAYRLDAADTTTADNGGTVIVAADGGRWKLVNNGSVTLRQFGAKGDGTTDDTAAIQAALSNCRVIKATRGQYIVTQKITVTLDNDDSLSLIGDGTGEVTIELNTGGDGLEINLLGNWWLPGAGNKTGLTISDVSFSTTNAYAGVGIAINGVSVQGRPSEGIYLNRVRLRGKSSMSQFWSTGILLKDCCPVWINSPDIHMGNGNAVSTGIEIIGTAQENSPVHFNIVHPEIYFGLYAIRSRDYVEGVYVTQPSLVGCQHGVYCDPAVGESGLHLVGGHISAVQTGVSLINMFDALVSSCLIFRNGTTFEGFRGVRVFQAGRISLTGNVIKGTISGTGETGIYVENTIADEKYGCVVSDNVISDMNGRGIWLGANANYVVGGNNNIRNCAVKVLRQDTARNSAIVGSEYSLTQTFTLTGGSASETIDLSVPAGIFRQKPEACLCTPTGNTILIISYLYDDAATTATNLRFVVRNLLGGNIVGATYRFNFSARESTRATT